MPSHRLAKPKRHRRRLLMGFLVVLAVAGSVVAANSLGSDSPPPSATDAVSSATPSAPIQTSEVPSPQAPPPEPLVLSISVDGLNPDALTRLGKSGTPNFHRLMGEGASTLNARSALELTITLPNHTGMLTGRGVEGPDGHGVTFNSDNGDTLQSTHGTYVPGMFDVAHDNGLQTAFFAEKDKFRYLIRSWDSQHGAADQTGADNGRDKVDIDAVDDDSTIVSGTVKALNNAATDLIFLHLRAPDSAGHAKGWLGAEYMRAVRSVDQHLGTILDTLDKNPSLSERVTILLTADHGGQEGRRSHSDRAIAADYTIPFIAWGNGVAAGADMYQLNAGRKDPGRSRPAYDSAQPIRNMDLGNTALSLLGLDPIPGAISSSWPGLRLK